MKPDRTVNMLQRAMLAASLRERRGRDGMLCPYCGFAMERNKGGSTAGKTLMATLDHILPQVAGGSDHPENLRIVCQLCNGSRGATGHCVGALACVRAVLGRKRPTESEVSRLWTHWRRVSAGLTVPPPAARR